MSEKFNQGLSIPKTPGVPFKEAIKEVPSYTGSAIRATVGMSFAAGIVFIVATVFLCIAFQWQVRVAFAVGGVAMFVVAIYWFSQGQSLMWQREEIIGQDINNDGFIGQPQLPPASHVVVEAQAEDGSNSWVIAKLPGDKRVICAWIKSAIERQSLAVELWEPQFGDTFSRSGQKIPIYTIFKQVLRDRGYLIDRGSHGVILSNEGRRVLSGALEQMSAMAELTDGRD